jgi:subtilisin family serine protease
VTYVVAAGNSSADACNVSPARLGTAITVGASDQADVRASFSNFGPCVDLFAPGVNILSAWAWNDYASFTASGTSMASPHVAGAVALYLEEHPDQSPAEVTAGLMGDATSGTMNNTDGSPNLVLFTAPNGPTAADATVSGRIVDPNGRGLKSIRVALQNAGTGETRMALTNAFGYFRFDYVEVGGFYVVRAQNRRYTFTNNPYSFTLSDNFTSMNFIGMPQ